MIPANKRAAFIIKDLSEQTPRRLVVGIAGEAVPPHFIYADNVTMSEHGVVLWRQDDKLGPQVVAGYTKEFNVAVFEAALLHLMTREEFQQQQVNDSKAYEDVVRAADPDAAEAIDAGKALAKFQRRQIFEQTGQDDEKTKGIPKKTGQYI